MGTRNAVERAVSECFHRVFGFSKTFMSILYSLETRTEIEMCPFILSEIKIKVVSFQEYLVIVLISSCQTFIHISCLACCRSSCRTKFILLFLLLRRLAVSTIGSCVKRDEALVAKF